MYEAEIAECGFVVAGCEPSRAFKFVEAAFDLVAQSIDEVIDDNLVFSVGTARDDWHPAAVFGVFANMIRVISLVCDQNFRWVEILVLQGVIALVIGDLAASDLHLQWQAPGVCEEMNLCREATF